MLEKYFFVILVSYTAITWKFLFVQLKRCSNSLKFLFREHAFIWNKASDLSLLGIFIVCNSWIDNIIIFRLNNIFSVSVISWQSGKSLRLQGLMASLASRRFGKIRGQRHASWFHQLHLNCYSKQGFCIGNYFLGVMQILILPECIYLCNRTFHLYSSKI